MDSGVRRNDDKRNAFSAAPKVHAHSLKPSISYSRFQDGRALMRVASAANAGQRSAGFGMLRDQRISMVA